MDVFLTLVALIILVAVVIFLVKSVSQVERRENTDVTEVPKSTVRETNLSYVHRPHEKNARLLDMPSSHGYEKAEMYVTDALCGLGHSYIIFTNLIIDKPGIVKSAEIDQLVISPYGLFCIETKSHQGNIYGSAGKPKWTQYLGNKQFSVYNSVFQSQNHAKALHDLLGARLKSKIHSFVVFPNAHIVKVNSSHVFTRASDLIEIIDKHRQVIYSQSEITDIAHLLARYTSEYASRFDSHKEEVRRYVKSVE